MIARHDVETTNTIDSRFRIRTRPCPNALSDGRRYASRGWRCLRTSGIIGLWFFVAMGASLGSAGCYRAVPSEVLLESQAATAMVTERARELAREEAERLHEERAAEARRKRAEAVAVGSTLGDGALRAAEDAAIVEDVTRSLPAPQDGDERSYLTRPCRVWEEELCVRRDLDRFYEKLRRLWLGDRDAKAVYSQWGDSLVINDHYTGRLRTLLQDRFGDAGYGFLYVSNPIRHMGFQGIRLGLSKHWAVRSIIRHSGERGIAYGIAGAEFVPDGRPTLTMISDFDENDREFARFGLLYHVPNETERGSVEYTDREGERTISLRPQLGREGMAWIETKAPVSRARLSSFDRSLVYYGVIIETGMPGVMVDNMGLVSGRIFFLLKIDREQWAQQIRLRDPDVVSLWYGVNSSGMERDVFEAQRDEYTAQYRAVLARVREDQPDRDCLVISVATRGDVVGRGVINDDSLDLVADVARAVSGERACAFLDAYQMVGGESSASDWYFARPQLLADDVHHFTVRGYWKFAELVHRELMHGFIDYLAERAERVEQGLAPYRVMEAAERADGAGEVSAQSTTSRDRD